MKFYTALHAGDLSLFKPGDLVLALIAGLHVIIGYWWPGSDGFNWIIQPHRRRKIRLTGRVSVQLIGVIA